MDAIAAQIHAVPKQDGTTDWREVRVIEISAGRAVRVRGVSTDESSDGSRPLSIVSLQTLIPIPHSEGAS